MSAPWDFHPAEIPVRTTSGKARELPSLEGLADLLDELIS